MLKENSPLHDRWVAMVDQGSNAKLATENHAASVLHEQLLGVHNGNKEVQHDPVMLSHLEPT